MASERASTPRVRRDYSHYYTILLPACFNRRPLARSLRPSSVVHTATAVTSQATEQVTAEGRSNIMWRAEIYHLCIIPN